MKKILVSSLLVVSLIVTGCTNSSNSKTSSKESFEVDVLNVDEYVYRFGELYKNTASIGLTMDFHFGVDDPKEVQKYYEKYKDYEDPKQSILACLDAYKDFIDSAVKFKSNDDTINEFHNKMIKNAILTHTVLEETNYMYEKYEKCLEYSKKGIEGDCDHLEHNPDEYKDIYYYLEDYAVYHMLTAITPLLSDYNNYLKEIGVEIHLLEK